MILESLGFRYVRDGAARDLVVVDQQRGPMVRCEWLEVGKAHNGGRTVAACRMAGKPDTPMQTPEGWEYEGSLSRTFGFIPHEGIEKSMTFLRHEDGADVYLSRLAGGELRIARSGGGNENRRRPSRPAAPSILRRTRR